MPGAGGQPPPQRTTFRPPWVKDGPSPLPMPTAPWTLNSRRDSKTKVEEPPPFTQVTLKVSLSFLNLLCHRQLLTRDKMDHRTIRKNYPRKPILIYFKQITRSPVEFVFLSGFGIVRALAHCLIKYGLMLLETTKNQARLVQSFSIQILGFKVTRLDY